MDNEEEKNVKELLKTIENNQAVDLTTENKESQEGEPIKTDNKGRFIKGTKPGPGRPKGKTIKEMVREHLDKNPEDMREFVKHFVKKNKELAWQMLEGRPKGDDKVEGSMNLQVILSSEVAEKNDINGTTENNSKE